MHPTSILLALLSAASTTLSAPLIATIPSGPNTHLVPPTILPEKRAIGSAHVLNNCPFSITLQPFHGPNVDPTVQLAPNGGAWSEPFQPTTSVKIWTDDPAHPAQFEYSLDSSTSKIFYDLSFINGNPFGGLYQAVIPAQTNCGPVECSPNQHCDLAYNVPMDDTATHGCPQSSDVTYYICAGPQPQVVPDTSR